MDKVILFYEHDDGYLHFETAFTNDDDAKVFSSMYSHFMQMEIPLNEERYMEKINAIKCFTNAGLSLFQVYLYLGKNKPAVYYSPWNNYISNPEIIKHDANVKYKGEMYLYYVIAKDEKEALNKAIQFRNELLANNNWVSDKKKKKGMSSKTRYALYLTLKKEFEKEK